MNRPARPSSPGTWTLTGCSIRTLLLPVQNRPDPPLSKGRLQYWPLCVSNDQRIYVWPGHFGFMVERLPDAHAATAPLHYAPPETRSKVFAPPLVVHGWSASGKKSLAVLSTITHWRTLSQVLFGGPDASPFFYGKTELHLSKGLRMRLQTPWSEGVSYSRILAALDGFGQYRRSDDPHAHLLTASVSQLLVHFTRANAVQVQLPAQDVLVSIAQALRSEYLQAPLAVATRYFYATGLGGKLASVKRPDVIITNAGSRCYGATWADTDKIINSAMWIQDRGMNKLAATMQRLLTDPRVITIWTRLLSSENIEHDWESHANEQHL